MAGREHFSKIAKIWITFFGLLLGAGIITYWLLSIGEYKFPLNIFFKRVGVTHYFSLLLLILIWISYLIVIIGTIGYLWNILKNNYEYPLRRSKNIRNYKYEMAFTLISIILAVAYLVFTITNELELSLRYFEWLNLTIFILFLLIDIWIWMDTNITLCSLKEREDELVDDQKRSEKEERELKSITSMKIIICADRELSLKSIWFIDLPVILGTLVIICISIFFMKGNILKGLTELGMQQYYVAPISYIWGTDCFKSFYEDLTRLITQGFSAGTISIEILISQFIFAVLRTQYYKKTSTV
jgi:hypothetical protein